MEFRTVTDQELGQVRYLDDQAASIRKRILMEIDDLGKIFNGRDPGGVAGVEFLNLASTRVVGSIKTNFGAGRLRLEWCHNGAELVGKTIVERERFDNSDRTYWEPVYEFHTGASGGFTRSSRNEQLPQYFTRDHAGRIYGLGCSIFFAILNGPFSA